MQAMNVPYSSLHAGMIGKPVALHSTFSPSAQSIRVRYSSPHSPLRSRSQSDSQTSREGGPIEQSASRVASHPRWQSPLVPLELALDPALAFDPALALEPEPEPAAPSSSSPQLNPTLQASSSPAAAAARATTLAPTRWCNPIHTC